MPDRMKAIGFRRYGDAGVQEEVVMPQPALAPNQLWIHVAAAGVNPADWRIRSGQFRLFMRPSFPFVPGAEVAGIVAEVGEGVTNFRMHDRVWAMLPTLSGGGYAQQVAVDETAVAHVPEELALGEAAAVPLTALTALQALSTIAQLRPQERVLIYGASGGVGHFAVQIARALGAEVTAMCSGRNVEWVKSLGAERVIDYTQEIDFAQNHRSRQLTDFDVVFDAVNHSTLR